MVNIRRMEYFHTPSVEYIHFKFFNVSALRNEYIIYTVAIGRNALVNDKHIVTKYRFVTRLGYGNRLKSICAQSSPRDMDRIGLRSNAILRGYFYGDGIDTHRQVYSA